MIRKFNFLTTFGVAVLGLTLASAPALSTTIKATGCFIRTHDYINAFFDGFIKPLNAKHTSLKIKYLGGVEVIPRKKQAGALKRGVVDMIHCPGAYYGGELAEARLPGAQNRSIKEIRSNGGWQLMQKAWGQGLNAHILAWVHFKGQKFYIYTLAKPKLSAKTGIDLTGIKMRATGLYKAFLKAMGATPIVISPGDVYASLERGLVQGLAWPWGSLTQYGWEKFIKYRVEPDFFGASMLTLINLDKYKSLTKAERDQLDAQARSFEGFADAYIVKKAHADDAKLFKAGVKSFKLTGKYRDAYLKTIYGAKWAENDSKKYSVDYKKLKAALYDPNK
jgi:TRAP-type mannitol/chloroaromatic compound transport system substrate-binding protein